MQKSSPDVRRRSAFYSRRASRLSRRAFLKILGWTASGLVATGCQPSSGTTPPTSSPASSTLPQAATPPATQPYTGSPSVAIARAATYDPKLIRAKMREMLDGVGGLGDVIRPGDRVAIKINLTGGAFSGTLPGLPAIETHATHPQVVQAIGEFARDAGAKDITIVESIWDSPSYADWGYPAVQKALNATVVDLNRADPYPDFASVPVGPNWYIYQEFTLNRILSEVDVFISVAKMKCHYLCGVTLSMKNLIGLVPITRYRLSNQDNYRTALHGAETETKKRLPRIVVDLNRARPVHLSVIDGIKTVEGGEGPWLKVSAVEPGVLIVGKNPVATDAVAAAVMGFNPMALSPARPFLRADNHLNLAVDRGLGTNQLSRIQVIGTPIADVVLPFRSGED